jgi:hypothetical protein
VHLTPDIRIGDIAERRKVDRWNELTAGSRQDDDLVRPILRNPLKGVDKLRMIQRSKGQRPTVRVELDDQHSLSLACQLQAAIRVEVFALTCLHGSIVILGSHCWLKEHDNSQRTKEATPTKPYFFDLVAGAREVATLDAIADWHDSNSGSSIGHRLRQDEPGGRLTMFLRVIGKLRLKLLAVGSGGMGVSEQSVSCWTMCCRSFSRRLALSRALPKVSRVRLLQNVARSMLIVIC